MRVEIADARLARAVALAVRDDARLDDVVVTDRVSALGSEPGVLLVDAHSACDEAVAAFLDGRACVVVAHDELDLLAHALAARTAGFAVLSHRVARKVHQTN